MSVVGISNQTEAQAMQTLQGERMMQKDDFLKMLTMQLRHQDPLNPMSNAEFASQLAQFSSLETLHNINDNIQTQIMMNQSMNNSFMINMIGKDVKSYGNMVYFDGETINLEFQLNADAKQIRVKVFDELGREVADFSSPGPRAGDRKVPWDGMMKNGEKAPSGKYTFEIEATNEAGHKITAEAMNNGLVTGITYVGGMPFLIINGSNVSLRDIISVNQGS